MGIYLENFCLWCLNALLINAILLCLFFLSGKTRYSSCKNMECGVSISRIQITIRARVSVQGVESLLQVYTGRLGVIVVDLCYFALFTLFTIKMIKSVQVFPFSFWKIITMFFLLHKIQNPGINMQNGRQVI